MTASSILHFVEEYNLMLGWLYFLLRLIIHAWTPFDIPLLLKQIEQNHFEPNYIVIVCINLNSIVLSIPIKQNLYGTSKNRLFVRI